MGNDRVDRRRAAAESALDRIDDEPVLTADDVPDLAAVPVGRDPGPTMGDDGFHVTDPDADPAETELDLEFDAAALDDARTDVLEAIVDTFNARDLDGLLDYVAPDAEAPGLVAHDVAELPAAVADLWRQRPSCLITRGVIDDDHVGVLWEHDGRNWWRSALLRVAEVVDGRAGIVALINDVALLERATSNPPGPDEVDEIIQLHAWEEGNPRAD